MTTPNREQVLQILQNDWLCEENAELKTILLEKDELVANLRRQLNVAILRQVNCGTLENEAYRLPNPEPRLTPDFTPIRHLTE